MARTHGLSKTQEYKAWLSMRHRCLGTRGSASYALKGIKVCERWASFPNFYSDMGPMPTPEHTIERKDNNGDYCPDNCVWATMFEQQQNRSNTRPVLGFSTAEVAGRAVGLDGSTIRSRLRRGWSEERAVSEPPKNTGRRAAKRYSEDRSEITFSS